MSWNLNHFIIKLKVHIFLLVFLLCACGSTDGVDESDRTEHRTLECRTSKQNNKGFCVSTDKIIAQCQGRLANVQKSDQCPKEDWCCTGFTDKPVIVRLAQENVTNSLDDAPCGHGNRPKIKTASNGASSIRRFARIFDGSPVAEGDMCWLAAIFDTGNSNISLPFSFVCAGAIINSTHIITAAHCVDRYLTQSNQIVVQTGISNASPSGLSSPSPCVQQFAVDEFILPSGYDPESLEQDMALLKIRGSIRLNMCTCRACLIDRELSTSGSTPVTCWVSGFGSTREGGMSSFQLTSSIVDFIRRDRCEVLLGSVLLSNQRLALPSSAICAGDARRGGLCSNDGGAPLTCIVDGRHTLVGIGSWSMDCSKLPSIFSSLLSCSRFLTDANAPCSLNSPVFKGAVALTELELNGGPSCGVCGTNEIDPFKLANQQPSKQARDARVIKQQALLIKTTALPTSTSFQMMDDKIVPEIPMDFGDDVADKLGPFEKFPVAPIIGGMVVPLNEICWQVLLSSGCGGSIISDQFILTAAHCVTLSGTSEIRQNIRVVLGATHSPVQLPLENSCQQVRSVRRVIVHENYFLGNSTDIYVANDIALLELDRPIDFTKKCVCRICLQNSEPVPGEICSTSGFGCQIPTAPGKACEDRSTRNLMKLNLNMAGDEACSTFFPNLPTGIVTCSASNNSHAPCFGDSGGPLVCYNNERSSYYQAGVTSFAIFPDGSGKCGAGDLNFQYYTKVKGFIEWIQNEVPDVLVVEPATFSFQASFNINLGKGLSSVMTNTQILPTTGSG